MMHCFTACWSPGIVYAFNGDAPKQAVCTVIHASGAFMTATHSNHALQWSLGQSCPEQWLVNRPQTQKTNPQLFS